MEHKVHSLLRPVFISDIPITAVTDFMGTSISVPVSLRPILLSALSAKIIFCDSSRGTSPYPGLKRIVRCSSGDIDLMISLSARSVTLSISADAHASRITASDISSACDLLSSISIPLPMVTAIRTAFLHPLQISARSLPCMKKVLSKRMPESKTSISKKAKTDLGAEASLILWYCTAILLRISGVILSSGMPSNIAASLMAGS
jgi:hypothetical protein